MGVQVIVILKVGIHMFMKSWCHIRQIWEGPAFNVNWHFPPPSTYRSSSTPL